MSEWSFLSSPGVKTGLLLLRVTTFQELKSVRNKEKTEVWQMTITMKTSCQKLEVFREVRKEWSKGSKEDIYLNFRLCGTMVVREKSHLLLSNGLQGHRVLREELGFCQGKTIKGMSREEVEDIVELSRVHCFRSGGGCEK